MPSEMENQFLIFSQHSSSTQLVYKLNKVSGFHHIREKINPPSETLAVAQLLWQKKTKKTKG